MKISWPNLNHKHFISHSSLVDYLAKVTKTCPNLSTYSKKNGELQWQHYFWDWYHEKFFPNQLKSLSNLTFSQIPWLFGLFLFTPKVTESNKTSKKWHFDFDSGKNVNFKLIGEDFFMISISKIMMPLWFLGFPLCICG